MWRYTLAAFGLENLTREDVAVPDPGPGEVRIAVHAVSLNYRDLLVCRGHYNPRLPMPCVPLSDGAGVVTAVGPDVAAVAVGDRVMSHFVADWQDGPYDARYGASTLGTPGPGLAAEEVVLPAGAVLPIPAGYDFAQAATLPIAALTAWNALVTEGGLERGQTVLTLGTGGVSVFAVQIAAALGARVLCTSSSDAKLARVRDLGAEAGINYLTNENWAARVLELTNGRGVDIVVENGGVGTFDQSLRAVRGGGIVAMLGALTGLRGTVDLAPVLMKRVRVQGILVGSKASFTALVEFFGAHQIAPVIDQRFGLDDLPAALARLGEGGHFGKIVLV